MNPITTAHPEFTLNGKTHYFVRQLNKEKLFCWKEDFNRGSQASYDSVSLDVRNVGMDTLKFLNIWEAIAPELQKEIVDFIDEKQNDVKSLMAKARGARRKKYENIPRELICNKCGKVQSMSPGSICKRLEKLNVDIDRLKKDYQCQKCNPTKGRPKGANKYKGLPKEMTCKCGKKIVANYYYLSAKAKTKGVTLDNLLKGFVCQECKPTKGRAKGSRKNSNKQYKDLPKKLKCKCGKTVTANYAYLSKKAESKGVTLDSLIKGFACQKCNPTIGRPRKNK